MLKLPQEDEKKIVDKVITQMTVKTSSDADDVERMVHTVLWSIEALGYTITITTLS